ncbi:nuclease-related domain-containing protein [Jeotgalibacillus marinus]|uniref:Nuclease-related domain-containing protein n=1 Tax=Jeotgalibacillus marinus TaxID=86667 RepID=A0ABV3Q063_9BACL
MAQLIKLQDYVSRYEKDMIRYPSQFVHLKKKKWEKIKQQWDEGSTFMDEEDLQQFKEEVEGMEGKDGKDGLIKRFRKVWVREEKTVEEPMKELIEEKSNACNESSFDFEPHMYNRPESLEDLKHNYLDQVYQFQLKWASSTLMDKSYMDSKYLREEPLRYFLQRFPDTYLVLYKPIILIKKAPVELDILVITPTTAWCILLLEGLDKSAYIGSTERFWTVKTGTQDKKILSPLISLDRTEHILKQLFKQQNVELPIKKTILSRNGYIDFPDAPFGLNIVDKRSYSEWFAQQRNSRSPLKHMQMKAAKVIIEHTKTTSVRRMQWSMDKSDDSTLSKTFE